MPRVGLFKRSCLVFMACCFIGFAYGFDPTISSSEALVQEARLKAEMGDWESAVLLYYRALKQQKPDPKAGIELSRLLVDAQRLDPEGEYSEVLTALVQELR